jgi:phosphoribosylcarboxyaminoimidazole (NCAIR) mutase
MVSAMTGLPVISVPVNGGTLVVALDEVYLEELDKKVLEVQ